MNNQLEIIVKESQLEPTKANYILRKFQIFFNAADEWATKAKTLVVTNASQTDEMEIARTGRLFLKDKRIAIETTRKNLKEDSLREGKLIDSIANTLKAVIIPIESYLEQQEKFVEIREEKKTEARRLEVEKRIEEEERIAAEKAAKEQERLRMENEKLKAEAQARERKAVTERKKQEEALAKERAKADAEKRALEEKARKEREVAEKSALEAREKADAERRVIEEKARKEREKAEAERKEKERLEKLLKAQVTCPHCGRKFQLTKEEK